MQERAFANEKIEFVWNSEVVDILGEDAVTGVVLRSTVDGSTRELPLDGVFVAIGNDPRTHLVHGKLDLTPEGTIWVDGRSSRTSVPGVFAAGDVDRPDLPAGGHRRRQRHGRGARRRALPRRARAERRPQIAEDIEVATETPSRETDEAETGVAAA